MGVEFPAARDPPAMSSGAAYLLDSHALLWWWFDPDRLSNAALELLSNPSTSVLVSAASVWELSLKHHQGKLPELSSAITDLPGCCRPMALKRCRSPWPMACGQAVTASPTAIRLIACWPLRPNWIAWCCSPPTHSSPPSPVKPSGEIQRHLKHPAAWIKRSLSASLVACCSPPPVHWPVALVIAKRGAWSFALPAAG